MSVRQIISYSFLCFSILIPSFIYASSKLGDHITAFRWHQLVTHLGVPSTCATECFIAALCECPQLHPIFLLSFQSVIFIIITFICTPYTHGSLRIHCEYTSILTLSISILSLTALRISSASLPPRKKGLSCNAFHAFRIAIHDFTMIHLHSHPSDGHTLHWTAVLISTSAMIVPTPGTAISLGSKIRS
jgi:hypothetical protein